MSETEKRRATRFVAGVNQYARGYVRAQRQAALDACYGRHDPADGATAVNLALRLQRRWRKVIYAYAKTLPAAPWLWRALDCPPSCGFFSPPSRPCLMTHLCPFCWSRAAASSRWDRLSGDKDATVAARRAPSVWTRVRDCLLPRDDMGRRPRTGRYDLVLLRNRLRVPMNWEIGGAIVESLPLVIDTYAGKARVAAPMRLPTREGLFSRIPVRAGVFTTLSIAPRLGGDRPEWEVNSRQLFAVEPGSPTLPPIDGLPYSCRVSRDPQIGYARAQVAALCTYPRGLLFGPGDAPDADGNLVKRSRSGFPDPAILGRYLAATHGRRLWEGYGCFRAPRAKETKPRRKRQSVRP